MNELYNYCEALWRDSEEKAHEGIESLSDKEYYKLIGECNAYNKIMKYLVEIERRQNNDTL